jgi:DNA-binding GntR family transcriptional regulator
LARHKITNHIGTEMEELTSLTRQHQSLGELTYQMIRNMIVSGEIQPGEWLRQEQLAQQLEVSHTPIRQALDWLVADGLAERVPNKGVRISEINENEIAEFYSLRLLLDPIVARCAAENISADQIERLQLIIGQLEKTFSLDDMPARRSLNREFHKTLSESAGHGTLERLYEIVWNRFPDWMFYEGLYKDPDTIKKRLSQEIEEHKRIFDSIATHNANLAERLSTEHIKVFMKDDLIEVFNMSSKVLDEMEKQMGLKLKCV